MGGIEFTNHELANLRQLCKRLPIT